MTNFPPELQSVLDLIREDTRQINADPRASAILKENMDYLDKMTFSAWAMAKTFPIADLMPVLVCVFMRGWYARGEDVEIPDAFREGL